MTPRGQILMTSPLASPLGRVKYVYYTISRLNYSMDWHVIWCLTLYRFDYTDIFNDVMTFHHVFHHQARNFVTNTFVNEKKTLTNSVAPEILAKLFSGIVQ